MTKERLIPSKFRIVGNICYLEVYNRKGIVVNEALIDLEDYEKVKEFRLHQSIIGSNYKRIRTNTGIKLVYFIVGKAPGGLYIDHINRNTSDNRKCNLRFVTRSQNGMNRSKHNKTTSIFKGVHWDKSRNKWKVEIKLNQICKHVGRFDEEEEAAEAYNRKAKELFGEYAALNIIKGGVYDEKTSR